jgi:hypothetical protein
LICVLDFSIHLYLFYVTDFFFSNIFIAAVSYCGFISARTFNKEGFALYLTYQYINVFLNIQHCIIYIYSYYSVDLQNLLIKFYNVTPGQMFDANYSIYLLAAALLQIFIAYYLQSFYNLFPKKDFLDHYIDRYNFEHSIMYNA